MTQRLTSASLLSKHNIKLDPNAKRKENFGAATEERMEGTAVFQLRIGFIDDSPYQPRQAYDPEALQELAATIAAAGQQEPVKVRQKDDGRYELISGHRRLRAMRDILQRAEIDAYIVAMSDEEAERATMLANEARANLSDYERAKLYKLALDRGLAKKQEEVAAYFGTNQGHVSRCLAMLSMPAEYVARLEENPRSFNATEAAEIRAKLAETAAAPQKRPVAPRAVPSIITRKDGRPMFAAKLVGREIAVRINDAEMNAAKVKMAIIEALKRLAEDED